MRTDVALFNVDTQQPSEAMDRLVFRPRVSPLEGNLAALLEAACRHDVLTVCSACVNAGDVRSVLGEHTLFIQMDADANGWRSHIHNGWRQIWLEKRSCGSRELNLERRAFDLFCANPHMAEVLDALGIGHYVVFGDSVGYCVRSTAEGLLRMGYRVTVVADAIGVGINSEQEKQAVLADLTWSGAYLTTTDSIVRELAGS